MTEVIQCPSCQRRLQVPEDLLGKDVQCPTCASTFVASLGQQSKTVHSPIQEPQQSPPPESPPHFPLEQNRQSPPPYPGEHQQPQYGGYDSPRYDSSGYDSSGYDSSGYDSYGSGSRRSSMRRRDFSPHRGGLILTLGIISLTFCAFTGPIAWIMGNQDLKDIRVGRMDPDGEGLTQAGRICGIISTILMIVVVAFYCLIAMAAISTSSY